MTYQETTQWMFNRLPMYQTQGSSAYKEDLTNTTALCAYLGNPERLLKFIHVAGTNGKGSTSHMLASILQEAGYKTGLYTSPHLKSFRERIRVNGVEISEEAVVGFIASHKDFLEKQHLSFFEMSVGLAFDYFEKQQVDIAIIEVGLGGRLDATNVIMPLVSVITNIGIDHVQFLGNTISAIAAEKAGIIKKGVPVVIGEYTAETRSVFIATAKEKAAPIYFAADLVDDVYPSELSGDYQQANKKTVQQTITTLVAYHGFKVDNNHIKYGMQNVIRNTHLQGRWQQLKEVPRVICDTAHNAHGLSMVMEQVLRQDYSKLHIVLGIVNDKEPETILPLFPKEAVYYFCSPNISRGLDNRILQRKAGKYGLRGEIYDSVPAAYEAALESADALDFIYIGGSTFVVAEVL
ncbi:MAG TPA: folylpolyglutamate synthase/dihydrofolate synthase family protein [Flavobacterium sp.]|jgi:dihydrofolate synthase/folylpolyglutamate synthase